MKTIQIELNQVTKHKVTIKLPCFFKVEDSSIHSFFYLYENKNGEAKMDEIQIYDGLDIILASTGCEISATAVNGEIIERQEYLSHFVDYRIFIEQKEADLIPEQTIESEEDETLSDEETKFIHSLDKADNQIEDALIRDHEKAERQEKQFEFENFRNLIREDAI